MGDYRDSYPAALAKGTILGGQYILEDVLGQGGFGITYKAQDDKTKEYVAIKEFLPDGLALRTDSRTVTFSTGQRMDDFFYGKQCFLEEARTLAEFIGNPNVVKVYNYFEENGTAYFVMEYVAGKSFKDYIKDNGGKVSYIDTIKYLFPVMDALTAAHSKGIIHRDVTPDNICIMPDGAVKLLDFGAARYSMGDRSRSLDVVLKHGYAPKEQYTRRGRQGPYTDVYSLAACYYAAITGRIPPDSIDRIDDDDLIPPSSMGAQLPECVEDAILKGLAVQPADRFQSVEEFKQALLGNNQMPNPDPIPDPTPVPDPIPKPDPKPKPNKVVICTVAAVICIVISLYFSMTAAIPDVVGSSYSTAKKEIEEAGLKIKKEEEWDFSGTREKGAILRMNQGAGTRVSKGTTVTVTVSLGQGAIVPDVSKMSYDEAESALKEVGLGIKIAKSEFHNTIPGFGVISQDIMPGDTVEKGTSVPITCSLGKVVKKGSCGPKATWRLSNAGWLLIDGSGEIYDYNHDDPPWYEYEDEILTVVIKGKITRIGNYAFFYCTNIMQVAMTDSVKEIGHSSFNSCYSLSDINLSAGLRSIEAFAFKASSIKEFNMPNGVSEVELDIFWKCSNLETVTLSPKLTEISSGMFEECTSLTSITIPASVQKIHSTAFDGCSNLKSVKVKGKAGRFGKYIYTGADYVKIKYL